MTNLETYLSKFAEVEWLEAINTLLPCVHEVDRNALQIWFRFYPLSLKRFIDDAEDRDATLHGIAMQGDFELKDQIDTSHRFLYGHRYWKTVKAAIEPLIGHTKSDFGMDRNYLKGESGDRINAMLAATASNFKNWMRNALEHLIFVLNYLTWNTKKCDTPPIKRFVRDLSVINFNAISTQPQVDII